MQNLVPYRMHLQASSFLSGNALVRPVDNTGQEACQEAVLLMTDSGS